MRKWDSWVAVGLLLLGGGCLVLSTALPFSPFRDDAMHAIHVLEYCLIALVLVLLLWVGVRLRWLQQSRTTRCTQCQYPLDRRWNYCPMCGLRLETMAEWRE